MDEVTPRDETAPERSSGCGKWIGGCAVLLLLAAIGVGYLIYKGPQILRWTTAKTVTFVTEQMLDQSLQLPDEEREAVMAPVERLADRVVEGEIEGETAALAMADVLDSNEAAVIALHGFESRYVDSDLIPEGEREAAMLTTNRFATGILDRRIPRRHLHELAEIVLVEREGAEEGDAVQKRLKTELSAEDIQDALAVMDRAVTTAGIDAPYEKRSPQELSALVDQAIERALREQRQRPPGGPGGQPPEGAVPSDPASPRFEPQRDEDDLGPAL